jgi:CTP:molybdopterin cytidylyltransferase MocA
MKPTLVILAAGMASRYGSMKQVEGFGPSGETIMDYSIYDAIRSGFGKVVFIIRKEFEKNFREIVGKDIEGRIEVNMFSRN